MNNQRLLILLFCACAFISCENNTINSGPGPDDPRDPRNPNLPPESNGVRWDKISMAHAGVGAVFDQSSEDFIVASTPFLGSREGGTILLSKNNGDSWQLISDDYRAFDLCIGPGNEIFLSTADFGVIRSTDQGSSWEEVNNGFEFGNDTLINSLYCAENGRVFAINSDIIYISENKGDNWEPIFEGENLIAVTQSPGGNNLALGVQKLYRNEAGTSDWNIIRETERDLFNALTTDGNGHIYYGHQNGGVYKSTDNGQSWEQIIDWTSFPLNSQHVQEAGINFVNSLFTDDDNYLYVSTSFGGYISTDQGLTWSDLEIPRNVNVSSIFRTHSGALLAGTTIYNSGTTGGAGIFRAGFSDKNWTKTGTEYFNALSVKIDKNTRNYYTAAQLSGVYQYITGKEEWRNLNEDELTFDGLSSTYIVHDIEFDPNGTVYVSTHPAGIFSSDDGGSSWVDVIPPSTQPQPADLEWTPDNQLYGVNKLTGVMKLDPNRKEWILLGPLQGETRDLFIDSHNNFYLTGEIPGGFFYRPDGGDWIEYNEGIENVTPTVVVKSLSSIVILGTQNGVYTSPDNGQTWNDRGLREVIFNQLVRTDDNVIYAATNFGVLRTKDDGKSWEQANQNLPDIPANSLDVFENTIILGTRGHGIFEGTIIK